MSNSLGDKRIRKLLDGNVPVLISRVGFGEMQILNAVASGNFEKARNIASLNVGVSPPTNEQMSLFSRLYKEAISKSDYVATYFAKWFPGERAMLDNNGARGKYDAGMYTARAFGGVSIMRKTRETWMRSLDNKRVLFIMPFTESAKKQVGKFDLLFGKGHWMPRYKDVLFLKTPQTQAPKTERRSKTWGEHFKELCAEVEKLKNDFDIALLCCGGYGLPLAKYIKCDLGRSAVYVGGGLPQFFGIAGHRHRINPTTKQDINKYWIRPMPSERPACYKQIENGCYW